MESIEIEKHGALRIDRFHPTAPETYHLHLNGETTDFERISLTITLVREELAQLVSDIQKLLSEEK